MMDQNDSYPTRRSKILVWLIAGGFGVGLVGLALVTVIDGDVSQFPSLSVFGSSCSDETLTAEQTERRVAWGEANTVDIRLQSSVNVRYRRGDGDAVILRGAPRDIADIAVGKGEIRSTCFRSFARPVEVTLPGRDFRKVHLHGSGTVIMEAVSQRSLELAISGSGSMAVDGESEDVSVSISGSGDVSLANLMVERLAADISGSGTVDAAPREVADIDISGSGEVRLFSRPAEGHTNIQGSGRVTDVTGG